MEEESGRRTASKRLWTKEVITILGRKMIYSALSLPGTMPA